MRKDVVALEKGSAQDVGMVMRLMLWISMAALAVAGCSSKPIAPVVGRVEVVSSFPHDPGAYTQGLFVDGGRLYESTGLYRESTLREVDLNTGRVLRRLALPDEVFGEGSARLGDHIWVLTWREQIAYRVNPNDLSIIDTRTFEGEGWGLTSDGHQLIKSDGTSTLRWIDPETFNVTRRLPVTENGQPVINLNELEYIDGAIYANVYLQDRIVRINPKNGNVTAFYDVSGLRASLSKPNEAEALNGIAWNDERKTLFVTGKRWPLLYEVKLVE